MKTSHNVKPDDSFQVLDTIVYFIQKARNSKTTRKINFAHLMISQHLDVILMPEFKFPFKQRDMLEIHVESMGIN